MIIIILMGIIILSGIVVCLSDSKVQTVLMALQTLVMMMGVSSIGTSMKSLKLSGLERGQKLVDAIEKEEIFKLPTELVCETKQFAKLPPKRKSKRIFPLLTIFEKKKELNDKQRNACEELNKRQIDIVKKCIDNLNDLAQLIEERIIDYKSVLSHYHTLILRYVYIVEPFRQMQEDKYGGNYGHRVLRLRHMAFCYNYIHSKHRNKAIIVKMHNDKKIEIVKAESFNFVKYISCLFRYHLVKSFS